MKLAYRIFGVVLLAYSVLSTAGWKKAREAEAVERGRGEEIARQNAELEARVAFTTERWQAQVDSQAIAEQRIVQIERETAIIAADAERSARAAVADARELLTELGQSTASVDTMVAAHGRQLAAAKTEAEGWKERASLWESRATVAELGNVQRDAVAAGLREELASAVRRAELLDRVASPSLLQGFLDDAPKVVVAAAIGVGAGYLLAR